MKSFPKEDRKFVLHSFYPGYWWPGDVRGQGISNLNHMPSATASIFIVGHFCASVSRFDKMPHILKILNTEVIKDIWYEMFSHSDWFWDFVFHTKSFSAKRDHGMPPVVGVINFVNFPVMINVHLMYNKKYARLIKSLSYLQESTQLRCGDTCQIWMWYPICIGHFYTFRHNG